jgi:hypothetical protein
MADLRQIFTYPTNLATDYIDPVWVGDASSGFTRRIDDLIDGSYSAWLNPTAFTATTSEVMQNVSKFGNYYESVSAAGHLSRYDFWYQPMVIATKKLIDSEDVTADATATPMAITTSNAHEFEDGQRIATSGINGTWGINIGAGNLPEMYAKVISNTELQISTTEDLTNLVALSGGVLNTTIFPRLSGDLIVASPGATPTPSGTPRYLEVDLSDLFGSNIVSVPDGQAITFNSAANTWSADTSLPGTYYLQNTATSATDHIYLVYATSSLDQGVPGRKTFSSSQSGANLLDFPLNGATYPNATINQTNPGSITYAPGTGPAINPNFAYTDVWVPPASTVSWSDHYFGPNGATGDQTASSAVYGCMWRLTPSGADTFIVECLDSNGAQGSAAGQQDWTPQDFTDAFEQSLYPTPQLYTSYTPPGPGGPYLQPWANVSNARIKINVGGLADNYVDGTAVTLTDGINQLQNDPYYLKESTADSTATYKVYDVYKNAALTNIVGPSDYMDPSVASPSSFSLFTPYLNTGTPTVAGNLVFRSLENTTTWQNFATTLVAQSSYSTFGITAGDNLTFTYDSVTETFTLTSHTGIGVPAVGFDAYGLSRASGTITGPDVPSSLTTSVITVQPAVSMTMTLPVLNTTTGQIGPYLDAASMPYEIDTVRLFLPGNKKFLYNTSTPGAQANTNKYWNAGGTVPLYYSNGATSAIFTIAVDNDGYLQTVAMTAEPDAEGRYPDGEDIMVLIEPLPDTVVPAPSPAYQADVFDTHNEWVDNAASPLKVWPNHVSPASANIVYNQPTNANMSQNGVKYTRGSGFTKWVLEVEYPGMKAKDFQKFHAMAQAMQGQSKSIYFPLRNKDDVSILWANMMDPGSSQSGSVLPDFVGGNPGYIPAGSLLLKLEGLTASDSEAFREGEVFIANANNNASLHTAIGAAASNAYGEAMVRMPYPLHTNLNQAEIVDKDPEYAIVTLNSDAFEYSVDVNNYYYVTVTFDLDQWGS